MQERHAPDPYSFERMNTAEIREDFLVEDLFKPGEINMIYWHVDRAVIGGAVPTGGSLTLEAGNALASEYFAQRREIGVINTGGEGVISVDGEEYAMGNRDALYIGRGSKAIEFSSVDADNPAYFYIISYPAHMTYPTTHAKIANAEPVKLGTNEDSNKRTIYKYIHPAGIQSCQLVMGLTELDECNVWNTMAAHLHPRRSEIYMYFDVPDDALIFHFMGEPQETRHIVVKNRQAALSPSWSIHSGSGTRNYSFIWAMGGENQEFGDMDAVSIDDLK